MTCGKVLKYHSEPINNNNSKTTYEPRSKLLAGILGIFFGSLGIHNFYLGYHRKGLLQLMLTLIGFFGIGTAISFFWGLTEGIMILTGAINKDAYGNDLIN